MAYSVNKFFEPEMNVKTFSKTGREEEIYLERIPKAICVSLRKPRNNSRTKTCWCREAVVSWEEIPFLEKFIELHHLAPNPSPESVNPFLNTLQKVFLKVSASVMRLSSLPGVLLTVCPKSLLLSLLCVLSWPTNRDVSEHQDHEDSWASSSLLSSHSLYFDLFAIKSRKILGVET